MARVDYVAIKRKVYDILLAASAFGGALDGVKVLYGKADILADKCPLVAVWSGESQQQQVTMGGTKPRRAVYTIYVDCVDVSMQSMQDADDRLASLLSRVEEVLQQDSTLGGLAEDAEVTGSKFDEGDEGSYQLSGATITFRVEVRT